MLLTTKYILLCEQHHREMLAEAERQRHIRSARPSAPHGKRPKTPLFLVSDFVRSSATRVGRLLRVSRPSGDASRVGAACFTAIALSVQFSDYGPLIPRLQQALQISAAQAGLLSSLLWLGLIAACLPAGAAADRCGSRPVLLCASGLMVLGGLLLPLMPALFWLLIFRAVIGVGAGMAFIAGAGVAASTERHPALAQGLYGGCVAAGSAIGVFVTPWLSARLGWQGAFFAWGLLALPALLGWLVIRGGHQHEPTQRGSVAAGLRSRAVWCLGLVHAGTFGANNVVAAWVTVYLVHQYGISLGLAATVGAIGLVSGALFRPMGGMLMSRRLLGAVALIRTGVILTMLGVALLALPLRQPILTSAGLAALSLGATIPYAAVFQSAARLQTVSKGVAQGLLSMIAWQALLWGPPLIGTLYQQSGAFSLPFGAILLLCAGAVIASLLIRSPVVREQQRSTEAEVLLPA